MPKQVSVSLDQIFSERQFSVRRTAKGAEALTKVYKAPATWNAEERSARFIMTAEVVDRYGDIVVTKGGDTTEFVKNPVALWAHDSRDFPIGMWDELKVISGTPKRMEGKINLSPEGTTEDADTVVRLLSANMVRACSIGFMPKAWESIKDDKDRWIGYKFLEWELLECSVCSIPANPAALVKAAGVGNESLALQAIELVLDEWARTPEGLIVPRSEYERAYEVVRDAKITVHEVRAIDETEEDDDAAAPVLTNLDIEAAVARGVASVVDNAMSTIAKMFGKTMPEVKATPEAPAEPEAPKDDAEPETDKTVQEPVAGEETEEEFKARMAAHDQELADEAEEKALRERAEAFA